MNKLLLRFAMLPSGLWRSMGADIPQLRAILNVKLIMDNRKPLVAGRQSKKPAKTTLFLAMLFSFLAGFMYVLPLLGIEDHTTGLFVFYTLFLLLVTFSLITDFSNVLIDTRDKHILLPRPVGDRTLALARILHVSVYLLRTVLPMGIPGWIVVGLVIGWKAALLFPLPLILLTAFSLFLVNGLYLLLLRIVTPEKFKEVINYFQILFSVLVFASYYLVPRMADAEAFRVFSVASIPWAQALPSYWLAAVWSWVGVHSPLPNAILFGVVAVLAPVAALWVTLRFLAPSFARKLGSLDSVSDTPTVRAERVKNSGLYQRLNNFFTRTPGGRAGFSLAWLQTRRSRTFKMRVYPSLAYVPVYFVWLLTSSKVEFSTMWENLPESRSHILLLYLSSFVLLQAITYLSISEQHKAAWIFSASPLQTPGRLMGGAFTAMWVKFFLPYFIVISAFVLAVWGPAKLPDLVLALCNVTLFVVVMIRAGHRRLPFSVPENMANSSGRTIRVILALAIPGVLGFAHYLASGLWWLIIVLSLLSAAALWMVWNSYLETGWKEVYQSTTE